MKKILVTTDGSRNSKKALLEAKNIASAIDGSIDILTVVRTAVVSPYMTIENIPVQSNVTFVKSGEKILDEALSLFDDFKGELNRKLKAGDPADVILKEAELKDYDLIIMGNRGLGTFSKTILGSVSNKVLNHAKTNVLIVK